MKQFVGNLKRYGTDIPRIGQMLFVDTYADRTHFIFELLQNAEDAIARRRRRMEWIAGSLVSLDRKNIFVLVTLVTHLTREMFEEFVVCPSPRRQKVSLK